MTLHIAIIRPPYPDLILNRTKLIEARLTKNTCPPFGTITPNDRIYFKQSSGPFVAVATASRVLTIDQLTPKIVTQLKQTYDQYIHADPAFWQSKRNARYATLIWLRDPQPTNLHPPYKPQNMRAWYTLNPNTLDPLASAHPPFFIPLTPGSLRNDYIILTKHLSHFPSAAIVPKNSPPSKHPLTLHLDRGPTITTDIIKTSAKINSNAARFRYRHFSPWFKQHRLRSGDLLQFTPVSSDTFSVTPICQNRRS